MANHDTLSPLFAALADPTRRAIVAALGSGNKSVSELANDHDMALPSFLKHIDKLERAGVITSHKAGRVRTCHLNPPALRPAQDWLTRESTRWGGALDRLAAHLDATEQETKQ
ncbi:MAG: metalloregulator ArsR/SmtB family transcription factor [Pseudomonadota bacterium]